MDVANDWANGEDYMATTGPGDMMIVTTSKNQGETAATTPGKTGNSPNLTQMS